MYCGSFPTFYINFLKMEPGKKRFTVNHISARASNKALTRKKKLEVSCIIMNNTGDKKKL